MMRKVLAVLIVLWLVTALATGVYAVRIKYLPSYPVYVGYGEAADDRYVAFLECSAVGGANRLKLYDSGLPTATLLFEMEDSNNDGSFETIDTMGSGIAHLPTLEEQEKLRHLTKSGLERSEWLSFTYTGVPSTSSRGLRYSP